MKETLELAPQKTVAVKAKELLDKVNFVNQIISTSPVIPIVENILFSNGYIFATDLQTYLAVKFPVTGSFLVPAKKFQAILKLLDKNDLVSIRVGDNPEIILIEVNGEDKFQLAADDVKDFPTVKEEKRDIGELTREDILAINESIAYASNDELRPAMMHILVSDHIVATNGNLLSFVKTTGTIQKFGVEEAYGSIRERDLPVLINQKAAKAISKFESAKVKAGEKYVFMYHKDMIVCFRNCDERYPDYKNVIPVNFTTSLTISKKQLLKELQLAKLAANKTTYLVKFDLRTLGSLMISSEDLDFGESYHSVIDGLEMERILPLYHAPVRYKDESDEDWERREKHARDCYEADVKEAQAGFEIGFNARLFIDYLKKETSDIIKMNLCKASKAAVMNDRFLLMPVMLKNYYGK